MDLVFFLSYPERKSKKQKHYEDKVCSRAKSFTGKRSLVQFGVEITVFVFDHFPLSSFRRIIRIKERKSGKFRTPKYYIENEFLPVAIKHKTLPLKKYSSVGTLHNGHQYAKKVYDNAIMNALLAIYLLVLWSTKLQEVGHTYYMGATAVQITKDTKSQINVENYTWT